MRLVPRLVDRYLLREFLRSTFTALVIMVVVVLVVDLWERMDTYLDHQAAFLDVARFHLLSVPFTILISVPVSLLLGSVFSLSRLARRNELTALRSAGVSLGRMVSPILLLALGFTFFSLAFNEIVVPRANRLREQVYDGEIQGTPRSPPGKRSNVSYLGRGGRMYQIEQYDSANRVMHHAMIMEFRHNRVARRLDAEEARWEKDQWLFLRGFQRTFGPDGREVAVAFDSLTVRSIEERPEDFDRGIDDPELMSFVQLRRQVAKLRASGSNPRRYQVEIGSRLAIPFANFIVVLLGAPLAASAARGGAAWGFGLGLSVAFFYYGLLRLSQTLGANTALPPELAPWVANSVFAAAGVYLLVRAGRK